MPVVILALTLEAAFWYGSHEGTAVVFTDGAALREAPLEGAEATVVLQGGSRVDLLGEGGDSLVIAGAVFDWYEAECPSGRGWISGADLAAASAADPSGGVFVFGVTGRGGGIFTGEARYYREGLLLASTPFEVSDGGLEGSRYRYSADAWTVDCSGLSGVASGFVLSLTYRACGFVSWDRLFVVTEGGELVPGPGAPDQYEAGFYRFDSGLLLPEGSGEADVVSVRSLSIEYEWTDDEPTESARSESMTRYSWNGRFFDLEP